MKEGLLEEVAWHVLAQMKLRNFAAASGVLANLREFDSQTDMTDGVSHLLGVAMAYAIVS